MTSDASVVTAAKSKELDRPRATGGWEIIRQFTPNWFTATMGTGILALAINQLPLAVPGLHTIKTALWLFNIALFVLFSGLYAARWVFFFDEASRIFGHSVVSMFFGAIPMGLATILNGFIVFGPDLIGTNAAITVATVLWWIDMAMALVCGVAIPFLMFTQQEHSIEKMTAVWLLPVVAAEVTAASAGLLVPHLANPHTAMLVLMIGYGLWAYSVPAAMSMLVILLLRLALHKLPHRDMAATGWLALGPIGTGALGLLLLGADAAKVFASVGIAGIGDVAAGLGVIGGMIFWGYGVWWFLLASMTTLRYLREGMPFNIGWWGFTFPIGVYAVATLALGRQTHLDLFLAIGGALVAMLTIFWSVVAIRTVKGAWNRSLFVSPCLITGAIPARLRGGSNRPLIGAGDATRRLGRRLGRSQEPSLSEQDHLIVRSDVPFNAEPTLFRLRAHLVTSTDDFYVRSHGDVPEVDPHAFRLTVTGHVEDALSLSLQDLRERFDEHTVEAVMQCAGNRREDLDKVKPVSGDLWAPGAIGSAIWTGVRLADVLASAGVVADAEMHVAFSSLDECTVDGKTFKYGASIPMAKAMSPEVLLAYAMNGEPLTAKHGFRCVS